MQMSSSGVVARVDASWHHHCCADVPGSFLARAVSVSMAPWRCLQHGRLACRQRVGTWRQLYAPSTSGRQRARTKSWTRQPCCIAHQGCISIIMIQCWNSLWSLYATLLPLCSSVPKNMFRGRAAACPSHSSSWSSACTSSVAHAVCFAYSTTSRHTAPVREP